MFSSQQNQVIKRDVLIKKIWEDNGVFVGRSLDTFISKLRKKFKDDDSNKHYKRSWCWLQIRSKLKTLFSIYIARIQLLHLELLV